LGIAVIWVFPAPAEAFSDLGVAVSLAPAYFWVLALMRKHGMFYFLSKSAH
jgi:hypothetical protein